MISAYLKLVSQPLGLLARVLPPVLHVGQLLARVLQLPIVNGVLQRPPHLVVLLVLLQLLLLLLEGRQSGWQFNRIKILPKNLPK